MLLLILAALGTVVYVHADASARNNRLTVAAPSPPSCTQVVCAINTLWLRLLSLLSWC